MSQVTWLAIEPLDTVMVRDGRSFDAGAASVATSTAPPPSTLGGVVRDAVGDDIDHCLIGPIVATAHGPVFPVPQDVVRDDDGEYRRLAVQETTSAWTWDLGERLSHALVGDGDPVSGFCDVEVLAHWLSNDDELIGGQPIASDWWDAHSGFQPWRNENRIGLALRPDGEFAGTAEPGLLYSMTHLRPADGARFLVGCVHDEPVTVVKDLVRLGGRGRQAAVTVTDPPELPRPPEEFPAGRVAVYLATPALLADVCWHAPDAALCAVALEGPQAIATASPREGLWRSRRLTWAVPAGTVFYLDFGDEEAARQWAHAHHGGLLPGQRQERLVTAGFGTCLIGRW